MPSVNTSIQSLQASTAVQSLDRQPNSQLDKDGFLRLLVEQLRHQDPTNAQDLSQQMAQVAQMSMVEQLTNLAAEQQKTAKAAEATHAQSLVGRTVTYVGADGATVTGTVEAVALGGQDGPSLTIGGVAGIAPASLKEVR